MEDMMETFDHPKSFVIKVINAKYQQCLRSAHRINLLIEIQLKTQDDINEINRELGFLRLMSVKIRNDVNSNMFNMFFIDNVLARFGI